MKKGILFRFASGGEAQNVARRAAIVGAANQYLNQEDLTRKEAPYSSQPDWQSQPFTPSQGVGNHSFPQGAEDETDSDDMGPLDPERIRAFNPFEGVEPLGARDKPELAKQARVLEGLGQHFTKKAAELDALLSKTEAHPGEEKDYYLKASVLACESLRQVLELDHLRKGVSLLAKMRSEHLNGLVSELTVRQGEFLGQVGRCLKALKISDPSTTIIVNDCRRLLKEVATGQAPRGKLFESIGKVTNKTCAVADELKETAMLEEKRERVARTLKTAGKALAGVGLGLASAGMLAEGIEPVFATGVGLVAAGLIQAAAQEL